MLRFRFKARSENGQLRKGVVEAQSQKSAVEVLRGQQLVIIELHELTAGSESLFHFADRVKFDDIVNFTRQLSTMVGAGLALTDALSILQVQAAPALQSRIAQILRAVEGGSTLADAMAAHADTFSKVYIALIRAGESAGVLDTILLRLADNLESQREFQAKTKGALIYPVIVVIGMTVVAAVMMIFVLPKLTSMYKDFNVQLPTVTKILIGVSNFTSQYWYIVILGIFSAIYGLGLWRKTKQGAVMYDTILLKVPIYGKIKLMVMMAEFTRTLALLAAAGVSLVDALTIVKDVVDSVVLSEDLSVVAKDVEKGNSLATSIAKHQTFPLIVSQMVSVGEQTGKLDEILNRVAAFFETESEHEIKNLSAAIEPLIMIVLGLGVGFLVVAIIVPIYNLTSAF